MLDINDTKMRYEDNPDNKNHATCTCEPLDRGYGTTIGSSLKRILLSSIQGAAVVAVRFQGAETLQDQLSGVHDSIQEIVLRLRELSIRPVEAPVMAHIQVEAGDEEYQVTAADILCQDEEAGLDILEPDTVLATVEAGGSLNVDLYIESGYGYVSAEKNVNAPEGMVAMDCVYSPLRRVEYKVQNTRVGNTTDYDRLIIEVETDGTISAADALNQSAKLMIDSLTPMWELADTEIEEPNPELNNVIYQSGDATEDDADAMAGKSDVLERPIEDLELNVRPANCMKRAGIVTIGDLIKKTDEEVKNLRNLGSKSFDEIVDKLAERGLSLRPAE